MDNRMSLLTSPFVPEGMVDLMKKLSKGVIKERPSNIYEYAADFFEKMLIERDGSLDKGYGKFRSYKEYCKFMDKLDQQRLSQPTKKVDEIADDKDTTDFPQEEVVQASDIEVQGVAIQGVERKSKDSVKNVSINPKYKSQSEKTTKPVVSSVKNVKAKPRKLSSKKPSENLIVIKEETSADVDDSSNGESKLHNAAMTIQKAFRTYMSKKSSQGEHSPERFGKVSKLSDDAAAIIIQKAFKALLQKLKPEAQNREKAVDEYNNNIVLPDAGQENSINDDKSKNNTDEHSEQILLDDDRTGCEHELEHKDTIHEEALDNTAINTEMKMNETTILTALEATATAEIETEEMRIGENTSATEAGNNQAAIASDINKEIVYNEGSTSLKENEPSIPSATIPLEITVQKGDVQELTDPNMIPLGEDSASHKEYEALIPSTTIPLNTTAQKGEIQELTDPSMVTLGEVKLKETENSTEDVEAQPSEKYFVVATSEKSETSDATIKPTETGPIKDDQAGTKVMENLSEATLESKPNPSDDRDVGKFTTDTEQDDVTASLNSSGTLSNVDNSTTAKNNETEIVQSEKQVNASQLEQTGPAHRVEPDENISTQEENLNLNCASDNIHKNSASIDNNHSTGTDPESPITKQLFLVEKDGIYVNMDLLQEKFGATSIDDGTGSDSEKTFKLNILEREEILVNQENVQQINEELTINQNIVDKSSIIIPDKSAEKVVEEVESTEASSCDNKDEEGNEEYELAETVVLMDIPSKPYLESENMPTMHAENECIDDTIKQNKLTDEIVKLESCADDKHLEKQSDSVKIMKRETILDEGLKNDAAVEKLGLVDQQSNKLENSESMANLDDDSIKGYDSEDKSTVENVKNQIIKNELTACEEIVKTEVISELEETENKIEEVESQSKLTELPEVHSEKIMKEESAEEEPTNDEKIENHSHTNEPPASQSLEDVKDKKLGNKLNINELSSINPENVQDVITCEEPKKDIVEGQLNKIEPTAPELEALTMVEAKFEAEDDKEENVENQCSKTELIATDSENILKLEDEKTKDESADNQLYPKESTFSEIEKIVSVKPVEQIEAEKDQNNVDELQETNSGENKKVDAVLEVDETRSENLDSQLNNSEDLTSQTENVVKVEETDKIGTEKVEDTTEVLQTTGSIVKVESMEDEAIKNKSGENQSNKNEVTTEDIVKAEAVEKIGTEKVENQLEVTEPHATESVKIKEVLDDIESKSENVDSQQNKSEKLTSQTQNVVNVGEVEKIETKKIEDIPDSLQATDSFVKVEDVEDEAIENKSVTKQSNKNEVTTEDIVKAEAVENMETEKVENQSEVNELHVTDSVEIEKVNELQATDSVEIEKVETVLKNNESDNADIQLNDSEKLTPQTENVVNVEAVDGMETEKIGSQLEINESHATDSTNTGEMVAALKCNETTNEKNESQLGTTESQPEVFNSKKDSTGESEDDEDISVSPGVKEEANEPVLKSENQLHEMDMDNKDELESNIYGKNEEVVEEKMEKVFRENLTSSLIVEAENQSVKSETGAEISNEMIKNKENEELVKAATIIQKVFRGYIVRNSTASNPNSKKEKSELWAALIIQKYARGYLVRSRMQKMDKLGTVHVASNEVKNDESDTSKAENNSTTDVIPQLPAYSNRFLIPKDSFLERESFADDEDYATTCKDLAATSIQKSYRGYKVRQSLKTSSENDAETEEAENRIDLLDDQVQTAVTEADRVISEVLNVAADVLPSDTYDLDSFEDEVSDGRNVELEPQANSIKPTVDHDSVLGQIVHDNIHVEGQMQQKFNRIMFQGTAINPIEEMSDSSEQPETPRDKAAPTIAVKSKTIESDSLDSKDYDGSKSFSYEQLSSDLSDSEEHKRESMKESEVDETSRDERDDDLSEVENFDLSSCGEDSLEAMYYSLRKNEIMVDRMQKQVAGQRDPKNNEIECVVSDNLKMEFPERVTENLDVAMQQVFKSMESSSDYDLGKKDEDDNSSTLDLALDDSSSINDEKEIETSRHVKQTEVESLEDNEQSESTIDNSNDVSQSPDPNMDKDIETSNMEQSQQSDSSVNSVNSSTKFIMKSQSVSEDMMNPIMFAMKRKQALLDQMHVRPYPIQENLSEDHDAFPEHLLTDIDIGNIQRKIFASSVSETDSDYIEPNTTGRRLVRDDFNISTALDHLSTDSDSTIVSAATKIQAGARGFLTRRRLRRSSAGGTSISFEKRYSFGNAAIDKSLEDLIKMQEQINLDGAALKIQQQYRRYQARKNNMKKVSPIREQTTLELSGGSSIEGNEGTDDIIGIREITLAQKKVEGEEKETHPISLNIDTVETVGAVRKTPVNQRRHTLQRGDAVQGNSRPDSQDLNVKDGERSSTDNQSNGKFKDSETGEYIDATNSKKEKKVTANINIQSLINRGIGPRQRSMPVQIDSELMRIIPKHLRKRVKSADTVKKRSG